jgi:hypothetical protein
LRLAAAGTDVGTHQHFAAAPVAPGHLEPHSATNLQENRPTKNRRLAPRFCRRSRILGSDQIAENRALLEELEAGNTAEGACFPRFARQMMGLAKNSADSR